MRVYAIKNKQNKLYWDERDCIWRPMAERVFHNNKSCTFYVSIHRAQVALLLVARTRSCRIVPIEINQVRSHILHNIRPPDPNDHCIIFLKGVTREMRLQFKVYCMLRGRSMGDQVQMWVKKALLEDQEPWDAAVRAERKRWWRITHHKNRRQQKSED